MKFSAVSVAAVALMSYASVALGAPSSVAELERALEELPDEAWAPHQAPEVEVKTPSASMAIAEGATPVVFMHGMGDSGSNPGMKSLCASVGKKYPGVYSKCLTVADGVSSITTVLSKQLDEFKAAIDADDQLKNGFHAVGLSQGNLLIRAYIQKYNDPPVKNYVSICGPHNGEGTCPDNILYKLVCPLWKISPYTAPIAFSDYWKDVGDESTYLSKSRWLADMNNEKETKNATYVANMKSLDNLVLVEALNDTIVVPHSSETMGFWKWGDKSPEKEKAVVSLHDTDGYKQDWIGLKSLDEAKKLTTLSYVGDHLRFSNDFWENTVLPYFKPASFAELE